MTPAVASPCVQVCEMDAVSGWCRGCARSLPEIANWGSASEAVQRQVLDLLPPRRQVLQLAGRWLGAAPQREEQDP